MFLASSVTLASRFGSIPRMIIPCTPFCVVSNTWRNTNGVAATTSGTVCDLVDQTVIVAHVLFHSFLDDDMCGRAENLALNVFSETGHDADRTDQRGHTERDPGNGDEGVQRDRPIPALGAQISQSDKDFVGEGHSIISRV